MEIKNQLYTQTQPKLLGKGSYGEVTLRLKDGKKLAIKSATKTSTASAVAIENEINILSCLSSSSPYIVSYYGKEETPPGKNLLMEYVSGGDLSKRGRIDDVEVIREFAWCLVEALRVVHREGFVHCDVKASNVLVDGGGGGGGGGVVKLADFGSSKKLFNDGNRDLTRGSPLWMAPEVVRGEEQGFAADVWSLGCTVIEMFTGKPAWRDEGPATLIKIGYSGSLPEYPKGLPELAKDFLDKCLVREVGQRWSCEELVRHPFLIPVTRKLVEVSPTSVLNWDEVDFSDVDVDDNEFWDYQDSVEARVAELSNVLRANWESDGWIDVRSSVVNSEIPCNYNINSTSINFGVENDDAEVIDGEDGGLICGKLIGKEKTNKNVIVELLFFNSMCSKLYSSYISIGLLLNVNRKMLLLLNLIKVPRFWIKVHVSNFFDNHRYLSILIQSIIISKVLH